MASNIATYDASRERIKFLQDSYYGGDNYKNPSTLILSSQTLTYQELIQSTGTIITKQGKSYSSYLIPHECESAESYGARLAIANYINLCEPVVSAYVDAATASIKRDFGKLKDKLSIPVDYKKTSYQNFVKNAAVEFAVSGFAFTVVTVDENASPIYTLVDPTKVLYLVTDEFGRLTEFAFINQSEIVNQTRPSVQNVTVTWITKDFISIRSGQIDFSRGYKVSDLIENAQYPLPESLGGELPIVIGYYKQNMKSIAPFGESLISTQADIGREVYNLESYVFEICGKTYPQLIYPVSAGQTMTGAEIQKATGTSVAMPYNSETNAPQYISPSKESIEALRMQIDAKIQEAYKAAKIDPNQSQIPQSGVALRIKSKQFMDAITAFAEQIKTFEESLLLITSKLTGIKPNFTIGVDSRFSSVDISEAIQNASTILSMLKTIDLKSQTQREIMKYVISNAVAFSPDVQALIFKDLDSVAAEIPLADPKQEIVPTE